ncbi:MAG: helix-turn-helix domain-containing protein [Eubacteriales bacterium]
MKTIKEFADFMSVSEPTVKRWIKRKELNVVRIGGTVRISEEEIERLKKGE